MNSQAIRDAIQLTYDTEAMAYAAFQNGSFAWRYIEKPGFDAHIKPMYHPQTRVLDIGCGAGVAVRHLIDSGMTPKNIVGIDISKGQIAEAKRLNPNVKFINASADEFEFASASFDLVVSNMAFDHFDDQQLSRAFQHIHYALTDEGIFFFVDTHPEYDESLKKPSAQSRWLKILTPWGSEQFLFNRSLDALILLAHNVGFDMITQTTLPIMEEGENIDPTGYQKYNSRPSRIAIKFHKRRQGS
jgi:ubiquinone/menaquinone biosynthesis C-methylase UbiE